MSPASLRRREVYAAEEARRQAGREVDAEDRRRRLDRDRQELAARGVTVTATATRPRRPAAGVAGADPTPQGRPIDGPPRPVRTAGVKACVTVTKAGAPCPVGPGPQGLCHVHDPGGEFARQHPAARAELLRRPEVRAALGLAWTPDRPATRRARRVLHRLDHVCRPLGVGDVIAAYDGQVPVEDLLRVETDLGGGAMIAVVPGRGFRVRLHLPHADADAVLAAAASALTGVPGQLMAVEAGQPSAY